MKSPFSEDNVVPLNKRVMICSVICTSLGFFLISMGVYINFILTDKVVEYEVYLNLDLKEDTPQFEGWVRP